MKTKEEPRIVTALVTIEEKRREKKEKSEER